VRAAIADTQYLIPAFLTEVQVKQNQVRKGPLRTERSFKVTLGGTNIRSRLYFGKTVSIRARPYFRVRMQDDEVEAWITQQSRQSVVAAAAQRLQQLWRDLSRAD